MSYLLFVNCELMRGFNFHKYLYSAVLLEKCHTAASYRLHSINDRYPAMYQLKSGEAGGASIAGELYLVDDDIWQTVQAALPSDFYRSIVTLDDGAEVYGILYPRELAEGRYPDITNYGGWQAYTAAKVIAA